MAAKRWHARWPCGHLPAVLQGPWAGIQHWWVAAALSFSVFSSNKNLLKKFASEGKVGMKILPWDSHFTYKPPKEQLLMKNASKKTKKEKDVHWMAFFIKHWQMSSAPLMWTKRSMTWMWSFPRICMPSILEDNSFCWIKGAHRSHVIWRHCTYEAAFWKKEIWHVTLCMLKVYCLFLWHIYIL